METIEQKKNIPWRNIVITIFCICIVGIFSYSNTFKVPFYFDDEASIVSNTAIHNFLDIPTIWFYQPSRFFAYWSFAFNINFFHYNLSAFHLVNLLIHLGTSIAVFFLIFLLQEEKNDGQKAGRLQMLVPLAAALFFVSHPANTQAVTYIVQRTASLAAFWYILSLVSFVKFRQTQKHFFAWFIFVLIFTLAAYLTKEHTFTLPISFLLLDLLFFVKGNRTFARIFFLFLFLIFLSVVVFAGTIFAEQHRPASQPVQNMYQASWVAPLQTSSKWEYFLTQINVVRTYLTLTVLPVNQNFDYDYPTTKSIDIRTLVSLSLHVILIAFAIRQRKKNPLVAFGILFFYLALSIESSVIPISDVIVEHRMYLPLVGMAIVFAEGIKEIKKRAKHHDLSLPAVISVTIILSVLAFQRNSVWSNQYTFWSDVVSKSPHKSRGYFNLGVAQIDKGNLDDAATSFQRSISLNPSYMSSYNNLGIVLRKQGKIEDAIAIYQKAQSMDPKYRPAQYNLGAIYLDQKNPEAAYLTYQEILNDNPKDTNAHFGLAYVYQESNNLDKAVTEYQKIIAIDPYYFEAYVRLGVIFQKRGEKELAKDYFKKAATLKPDNGEVQKILQSLN